MNAGTWLRSGAWIAVAALFFWAWPLLTAGLSPSILGIGVVAVIFVAVVTQWLGSRGRHRSVELGIPMLCFAAYLLLASVFNQGWDEAAWLNLGLQLLVLLTAIGFSESRESMRISLVRVISWLLVVVSATWLWAEMMWMMDAKGLSHQATYHVSGWFSHRNFFAQWLSLPLAMIWAGMLGKRAMLVQRCLFFALLLGTALLLSRSGWLNMGAVIVLALLARKNLPFQPLPLNWGWRHRLFVLALLAATTLVLIDAPYTLWHQMETLWSGEGGSVNDRMQLTAWSLDLIRSHPMIGIGLGNWSEAVLVLDHGGMTSSGGDFLYDHAHSDALEVGSESGTLAWFFWLAVFIAAGWATWKSYENGERHESFFTAAIWCVLFLTSLNHHPRFEPFWMLIWAVALARTRAMGISVPSSWIRFAAVLLLTIPAFAFLNFSGQGRTNIKAATSWWSSMAGINPELCRQMPCFEWPEEHPAALWEDAQAAMHKGEEQQARSMGRALLTRFPAHRGANQMLAEIHCDRGETKRAMKYLLSLDYSRSEALRVALMERVAQDSLAALEMTIPERGLMMTIRAMANTPTWAASVLKHASINRLSFKDQAIADACYYMKKNCHGGECDSIDALMEKYIPEVPMNLE